jgi:hypothetical protein
LGGPPGTQRVPVPGQRPLAGQAVPPGQMPGCVEQHGDFPVWCDDE